MSARETKQVVIRIADDLPLEIRKRVYTIARVANSWGDDPDLELVDQLYVGYDDLALFFEGHCMSVSTNAARSAAGRQMARLQAMTGDFRVDISCIHCGGTISRRYAKHGCKHPDGHFVTVPMGSMGHWRVSVSSAKAAYQAGCLNNARGPRYDEFTRDDAIRAKAWMSQL